MEDIIDKKMNKGEEDYVKNSGSEDSSGENTKLNVANQDKKPCNAKQDDIIYSNVIIEKYDEDHNCLHECIRPSNKEVSESVTLSLDSLSKSKNPAKTFPYELDPFQKTAIRCLEKGESVLVSAHTSSGKTTVAEYAIAMGLRDKHRVVYTSPIKALSNQKYRDLSNLYENDVGLLTGDVSLNPNAPIIIMTTEILRSMLYRGSELIREIKWVIFDEIHYMRDRDRGVVWEETIILLPDVVRLVFLSATIPNASEFAEWICRIKHQACHVIYTDYRPVPLQHFIFPSGGDNVHLVVDEKKKFKEENFKKAMAELEKVIEFTNIRNREKKAKKNPKNNIENIVKMCHERNYTPVIVFAFSKREVEANALSLKNIKLTSDEEEQLIITVFNNAIKTLGDEKNLPQIECILPLLQKGIGLHHGGLLPIVKEIIEILFQESLVKVLFSTETFSMGVNMPAKTVIFTKLTKWDGIVFRSVSSGEYIQMSGRAGRRGIDDRGISIIILEEQINSQAAKNIILGEPMKIDSQFRLSYCTLLNLLRIEAVNPDYMIQRSFYQFQKDKQGLQLGKDKCVLEDRFNKLNDLSLYLPDNYAKNFNIDFNICLSEYYLAEYQINTMKKKMRDLVMKPKYILRFLQVGRIVKIGDAILGNGDFGVIVKKPFKKRSSVKPGDLENASDSQENVFINVLLPSKLESNVVNALKLKLVSYENNDLQVKNDAFSVACCDLSHILEISQVIANISNDTGAQENNIAIVEIFKTISLQLNNDFPIVDPVNHMQVNEDKLKEIVECIKENEKIIRRSPLNSSTELMNILPKYKEKVAILSELKEIEWKMDSHRQIVMKDELTSMLRILRELDYISFDNIVTLKGKAACELSSVEELVLCELLFRNTFQTVPSDYLAAMLSCFVFDEKTDFLTTKDEKLLDYFRQIREVAIEVATVSKSCKLSVNVDEFAGKFKADLMEVVLKWMHGAQFNELGLSENIFEGTFIRCMRRLEELLRQLISACKTIGEQNLESRLTESVLSIRRGIIFAASLYF